MNELFRIILPLCIIFVFGYIFVFKSHLVSKKIDKPTMVLPRDGSLEHLIGIYFKIINYGIVVFCITYGFFPKINLHLGSFQFLNDIMLQIIGLILLIISSIWMILAQVTMRNSWRMGVDKKFKTDLIINGLFRISRNPFFIGLLLFFLSIFLILPNTITLILLVTEYILISIQIRIEEQHLLKTHGNNYLYYMSQVKRYFGRN